MRSFTRSIAALLGIFIVGCSSDAPNELEGRSETTTIPVGSMKTYDTECPFKCEIILDVKVEDGLPINAYLFTFESTQAMNPAEFQEIRRFRVTSVNRGRFSAPVDKGRWSIVIGPSPGRTAANSQINVNTYIQRIDEKAETFTPVPFKP